MGFHLKEKQLDFYFIFLVGLQMTVLVSARSDFASLNSITSISIYQYNFLLVIKHIIIIIIIIE